MVGECARDKDMELNLIKGKKLTNMRASGSDKGLRIAPAKKLSLEEYLEWIADDEYLEVTPGALRVRKIPRVAHTPVDRLRERTPTASFNA